MKTKTKKRLIWVGLFLLSPLVIFLFLAVLLYLPPIQRYVTERVTYELSKQLDINVRVGQVRLSFPLDLALHHVQAYTQQDTLLNARALRLGVSLRPLFESQIHVHEIAIFKADINTLDRLPEIKLHGQVGTLTLDNVYIDLKKKHLDIPVVNLDDTHLAVALLDTILQDTTPSTSLPWLVKVAQLHIQRSSVSIQSQRDSVSIKTSLGDLSINNIFCDLDNTVYKVGQIHLYQGGFFMDRPGPPTQPSGLDLGHLRIAKINLQAQHTVYSPERKEIVLKHLSFAEKSGFRLDTLSGQISWVADSIRVRLSAALPHSKLSMLLHTDTLAWQEGRGGGLAANLNGHLSVQDVLPYFSETKAFSKLPHEALQIQAKVQGNIDKLEIEKMMLHWPQIARANLQANLYKSLDTLHRKGAISYQLSVQQVRTLRPVLRHFLGQSFTLPSPLNIQGNAQLQGQTVQAKTLARLLGGSLQATARFDMHHLSYDLQTHVRKLPLQHFLPQSGIGFFTGNLQLHGRGFDYLSPQTRLRANLEIQHLQYADKALDTISISGEVQGGKADFSFSSKNAYLAGEGKFLATLHKKKIHGNLSCNFALVDLFKLGFLTDTVQLSTHTALTFTTDRRFKQFTLQGDARQIRLQTPTQSLLTQDLSFDVVSRRDSVTAAVSTGDLLLQVEVGSSISALTRELTHLSTTIDKQLSKKYLDQTALKESLPNAEILIKAGPHNFFSRFLAYRGFSFDTAFLSLTLDKTAGINGMGKIDSLQTGALLLDNIGISVIQDDKGVQLEADIDNTANKNPNQFMVNLRAALLPTGFTTDVIYRDKKGREGLRFGLMAEVADSGLTARIYPARPIIAYRDFLINPDNFIHLGRDKSIHADVELMADDGTGLQIYNTEVASGQNDITLSINRLNLGELSDVLPYMPAVSGMLSGDVHLVRDLQKQTFTTSMSAVIQHPLYDGVPLGRQLGVDMSLLPQEDGQYFNAMLQSDGMQIGMAEGYYHEDEGNISQGLLALEQFPLSLANGFMDGTDFSLAGTATGEIQFEGLPTALQLAGSVAMDSVHILSAAYGVNLAMEPRRLHIVDQQLQLDKVKFLGNNKDNPLWVDGSVNLNHLDNIALNLRLQAQNYPLIQAQRNAYSTAFGELFVDIDTQLFGNVNNLTYRGRLTVLDDTNLSYVLKDSPLSNSMNLKDLVHFVSFDDSLQVTTPLPTTNITVNLGIKVNSGANFYCDLGDGESYVEMEGGGELNFKYLSGEMLLLGRYTINNGEMKYAMPVIPLKTFQIEQGSHVDFTGNPMNPQLSITATERTRASVGEGGNNRTVNFDVGVVLTNYLNQMGLSFTLAAPQDLAIQNQLASMTKDQRAKLAVTMLATGAYMVEGNNSSFNANNALSAFLQSEIQSIAGDALKSIDLSFGMQSGTDTQGRKQTDYSFRFAKRFWGDRFTVIIGGTISSGSNNRNNNNDTFIDNVSLQYRLDKSGTRYVTIFYDRDSQDPLQGQYSETGVSLILRRKTNNLGELFIFRRNKRVQQPALSTITK